MPDKMMRMSGRGDDGTAKAIKVNNDGELKTDKELLHLQSQVDRTLKLMTGIKEEYYYEGKEIVNLAEGYKFGSGSITKRSNSIVLEVNGNPSDIAETSVAVGQVNLTGIDEIYVEYDIEGHSQYATKAWVTIGTNPGAIHSSPPLRKEIHHAGGTPREKKSISLDVSHLTGERYINIHLLDVSGSISINAKMNIYNIWGEKLKPNTLSFEAPDMPNAEGSLTVKDYQTGEDIDLTAVRDNDGKSALRIVDAAPYGFDSENDSLRTVKPQVDEIKELSTTNTLTTNSVFETGVINVGNINELIVSVDGGQTSTPLELLANYYLSDRTTLVKSEILIVEEGSPNYHGTAINFKPNGAFFSLSIKNKASTNRTFKIETFGGR